MELFDELFELIFSLVPIIIFIIVGRGIARASKGATSGAKKSTVNGRPVSTPKPAKGAPVRVQEKSQPLKAGEKASPAAKVLAEDRKNDWLAKQLREEARIARRNRMDLGAVHEADCDADSLKKEHRKNHKKLNQQF